MTTVTNTLQVSSSATLVKDSFAGTMRVRLLSGPEIAQVRTRASRCTFMSKRRLITAIKPPAHVGKKQLLKQAA